MEKETQPLSERDALYLGALLHDIGKFWHRGESNNTYTKHQLLSASFVNTLLENERINFIVAHHHKVDLTKSNASGVRRILAEIACEADNLASGERNSDSTTDQRLLQSIFSSIRLDSNGQKKLHFQPISALTPNGFIFPTEDQNMGLQVNYADRWGKFTEESQKIGESPETLLHLLKKYLWCIPSASYKVIPDVSLYEHSRLTAAIAICMLDYLTEKHKALSEIKIPFDRNETQFVLLGADLTGIQNFIYNIAHKGAVKALKGRSFQLQQLLDGVADTLLSKLNLPLANLLYSSGGKFYVLAPNTKYFQQVLSDIKQKIEKDLLDEYGGDIGICFGCIPLMGNDFVGNINGKSIISQKWDEVNKVLEHEKQRKFSTQLKNKDFFEPQSPGGDIISCYATGKDLCEKQEIYEKKSEKKKLGYSEITFQRNGTEFKIYQKTEQQDGENDEQEGKYLSFEQYQSQCVGDKLKQAKILVRSDKNEAEFSVLGLGSYDIIHEIDKKNIQRAYQLNDDNFLGLHATHKGWKFYGGDWIPETKDGKSKDFDMLADEAKGINRLGVLRMDVDNLGRIFKDGLGGDATFSRIVQLSTMLDFFFSSYLNSLQKLKWNVAKGINSVEGDNLHGLMQIIYAGGDDLFIIGVWNVLPDVAIWINNKFHCFTGNNPNFSLSAGISLFPKKYPLFKAAKLAGLAEDKAKGERLSKRDEKAYKNALTFLDTTMSWKDFAAVREKVVAIVTWHEKGMSRGLIDRLYRIHAEFIDGKGNRWAKWRWRACYSLARFGEQNKQRKDDIEKLSAELFMSSVGSTTEQDLISLLGVIATWADFLTRKENKSGDHISKY